MTTPTTQELINELMQVHNGHADEGTSTFSEAAQRLRELDEQVKQQINDYGRGMAIADLARKSDCIYTLCADDSDTPQTLESGCGGAVKSGSGSV
jgi:hypothetical protein